MKVKRLMGQHNRMELYTFRRLRRENPECVLPLGCGYTEAIRVLCQHAEQKAAEVKAAEDANVQTMWWNND